MKSSILRRTQIARVGACAVLLNFSVPGGALAVYGAPLRESVAQGIADRAKAAKSLAARRAKSASRLLSAKEEGSLQGRAGENPYLAGGSKWDVMYKGIDLMTGSYTANATDLSFDGGYGIPVNVTRSYNSNNGDAGPFGKGWTLSADVRSTAGGLLKSSSAPVRSVPTTLKERSGKEDDPNVATEPAAAVTAIDAGGTEETIQKDVDGILTTPAWDKNVYDSQYEFVEFPAGSGVKTQLLVSNSVKTPEGTIYTYAKQGSYPNGTTAFNDPSAAAEAANVLKVTSATDRQGNVTTYTYSPTVYFDYIKSNGTTHEHPLTQVSMPGGHVLAFAWGTSGNAQGRVTSITDNPTASLADQRVVAYGYGPGGLLTSVTTPGGKATQYGYGAPYGGGSSDLLNSITNPRGLTETILYLTGHIPVKPYNNNVPAVVAYGLLHADGTATYVVNSSYNRDGNNGLGVGYQLPPGTPPPTGGWYNYQPTIVYYDTLGGNYTPFFEAEIRTYPVQSDGTFAVDLNDDYSNMTASVGSMSGSYNLHSRKEYSVQTQDLIRETHRVKRWEVDQVAENRALPYSPWTGQQTVTTKAYNFMGQPLSSDSVETWIGVYSGGGPYPANQNTRLSSAAYAYWGPEKYYQQKAVRTGEGASYLRYSFTDYYVNTDAAGKRGQTKAVYDPKYGGIVLGSATVPSYATSGTAWRYQVQPTPGRHAARFDYDAKGRPTDVWKLQKAPTNGTWSYVQTHTQYGGDGAPGWGQASQVVEDYGGINRTTQTLAYTSWGKACDVVDAAGHEFVTTYDKDGLVQSVARTDQGSQNLVTYGYGTTGVSNGQPTTVTDGLSGVSQTISYVPAGTYGVGQPASMTETSAGDAYSMAYTYSAVGDRATTTQTDNGVTVAKWGYYDYNWVGNLAGPSRVFQTLCRLDAAGNRTAEEMHYRYDTDGRLTGSAFAQTPSVASASARGWYDTGPASVRARAYYDYDAGGRTLQVSYYQDVLQSSGYQSTLIGQNTCAYETSTNGSSLNRGLKTASYYSMQGDGTRTETYGYDPLNDNLTEAHYGDGAQGFPYPDEAWGFDAAGNRSGNVVDNLNRATTAGGLACTNDVLGNRTSKTNAGGLTFFYTWDALNRLTAHGRAGAWSANYGYRADGMRVSKLYNGVTTRYRHDGQMAVEDVEQPATGNATITRYGLGARGVDFMEQTAANGAVTRGFPIYDAHGNNVATLYRNGNTYAVQNLRRYSAWGSVRGGSPTGDPKGKYCANLGHRQDDESGTTYMRARYYEPDSARFLSEDPAARGSNWFVYADNNPISKADLNGKDAIDDLLIKLADVYAKGLGQEEMDSLVSQIQSKLEGLGALSEQAAEHLNELRSEIDAMKDMGTFSAEEIEEKEQALVTALDASVKADIKHAAKVQQVLKNETILRYLQDIDEI